MLRQRSRVSESVSESGSLDKQNGSLLRQRSVDSGGNEKAIKLSEKKPFPVAGEKLIETEKSETGSVSRKSAVLFYNTKLPLTTQNRILIGLFF